MTKPTIADVRAALQTFIRSGDGADEMRHWLNKRVDVMVAALAHSEDL